MGLEQSLLTDGQVAGIVGAILAGFGAVAGAIKWGVGRLVRAIDEQTADGKLTRETVIELRAEMREGRDDIREFKAEVREGRDDIRELRAVVARWDSMLSTATPDREDQPSQPPRRRSRRMAAQTPPSGIARRANTENDQ